MDSLQQLQDSMSIRQSTPQINHAVLRPVLATKVRIFRQRCHLVGIYQSQYNNVLSTVLSDRVSVLYLAALVTLQGAANGARSSNDSDNVSRPTEFANTTSPIDNGP